MLQPAFVVITPLRRNVITRRHTFPASDGQRINEKKSVEETSWAFA